MTDQSTTKSVTQPQGRTRTSIAIIASLVIFAVTAIALWALTTLGFVYALATATPVTVLLAGSIVAVDAVGEFFAVVVEAIVAIFSTIAEAVGTVVAGILAALAAVFSIFGG